MSQRVKCHVVNPGPVLYGGVAGGARSAMSCTHHPATSYRRLTTEHKSALSDKDQRRQSDEQAKAKSLRDQQAQQLPVDQQKAGGSEASIQQRGRNVLGPSSTRRPRSAMATRPAKR